MVYVQAILFAFNNALSSIGITDILYIFAAILLIWYVVCRKPIVKVCSILFTISIVYAVVVQVVSGVDEWKGVGLFLLHMLLNITLMLHVVQNRWKWKISDFIWTIAVIQGVETIAALILQDSKLWYISEYENGVKLKRLQLFYHEPAYLSFICGILLLFFVYQLIAKEFSFKLVVGGFICLFDMILSYSMGGMVACVVSSVILMISHVASNRTQILDDVNSRIRWGIAAIMMMVVVVTVVALSPIYGFRLFGISQGTDTSLIYNLQYPISKLFQVMSMTGGRGTGIGQLVGGEIGNSIGIARELNNAFIQFIAEGGIYGILFIMGLLISLLYLCMLYGGAMSAALYVYIMLFQFTGGKFADPVNWFVYGWIIASCLRKKESRKKKILKVENENQDKMVTCAIIGAKGLGNYGGYETFVDKLTEYHKDNEKIKYLVACKANGQGAMDERTLKGAVPIGENEFMYHNAHCFKIKVPQIGAAQAIVYDLMAAVYCINYFKKHRNEKPILYVLTCRIGPFINVFAKIIHDLGGEYYVNPDGNEWRRSVWKPWIRRYWKLSERLMIKYADLVICDSKNIETYINASYDEYKPKTTYIAYGAEVASSKLADNGQEYTEWLKMHNISVGNYYLIVGRFVPENNYETILREYMSCKNQKDLVIITNVNKYFMDELEERLQFSRDKRIKFVGTVYHQELLKKIRENAYGYFHGHEVGGTNPSLLEALSSTKLNLLLNVGFNRECGEDGALYWEKTEGNLAALIERADKFTEEEIREFSTKAKKRIIDAYSWESIADKYEKVLVCGKK